MPAHGLRRSRAPRSLRRPFAVALLFASLLLLPSAAPPPKGTDATTAPLAARLDEIASGWHARGAFDGVVLVGRGDELLYARGFGMADRARGLANDPGTRFPVASITKRYAAVVAAQLAAEGALDLDAPVADALPQLRRPAGQPPITARHLLTHSSGLPDLADDPEMYLSDDARWDDPAAILTRYAEAEPRFAAGGGVHYSNGNYHALELLVEARSGRAFEAELRARLLDPLGLDDVVLADRRAPPVGVAEGYERGDDGVWRPDLDVAVQRYGAAGGMLAAAEDLWRLERALLAGEVLPDAARARLWRPDPRFGGAAMGAWSYPAPLPDGSSVRLVESRGALGAVRALVATAPETGLVLVILENAGDAELFGIPYGEGLAAEVLAAVAAAVPE